MKIEIEKDLLIDLKAGIMEAIGHEDGLDGGTGEYLLEHIDTLLKMSDQQREGLEQDLIDRIITQAEIKTRYTVALETIGYNVENLSEKIYECNKLIQDTKTELLYSFLFAKKEAK